MSKATKEKIRNAHMAEIEKGEWDELGIEKFCINEYQFRFVKGKNRLDYYPTSGKYFDLNLAKWGYCLVSEIQYLVE